MRQVECLALRWEHVELEVGTIEVAESLARVDGELIVKAPKSKRSVRVIPLPTFALDAMRSRHADYLAEREAGGYDDRGLVWGQRSGRPRDARRDYQEWVDLLAAAGVRKVRLHDARHSAATALMILGVPLPVISAILGHAQISTTMRYLRTDLSAMRAAMDLLDASRRPSIEP
jgi:integrase